MEYGIITNPYKNANKDRVYHIGDYQSLPEMKEKALEILSNRDNYRCSETKYHGYAASSLKSLKHDQNEADRRIDRLVETFYKYRENNTHFIANEYTPAYRVNGQFVDLGRVLNGEPECMIDMFAETSAAVKYLDVEILVAFPQYVTNMKERRYAFIFAYYLPFLDLIDAWEQSGIRCKISLIDINIDANPARDFKKSNDQTKGSLVIKNYEEIFDLELFCRVMFTDEVTGIFYYLGHAIIGSNPDKSSWYISPDAKDLSFVEYNHSYKNKVVIPSLYYPLSAQYPGPNATKILTGLNYPLENF